MRRAHRSSLRRCPDHPPPPPARHRGPPGSDRPAAALDPHGRPATLGGPLGSRFTILVAEDDESFLARVVLLLEEDGRFAVTGRARNGREAAELATALAPDAIVMDVEMPVLDGVGATRLVRASFPRLPIVAISGHDYEERALEIREAGADDYVRKARLEEELPRALAELLAHG